MVKLFVKYGLFTKIEAREASEDAEDTEESEAPEESEDLEAPNFRPHGEEW